MINFASYYVDNHKYVVFSMESSFGHESDGRAISALHDPDCPVCKNRRAQERRDMFAAAALTGLLANNNFRAVLEASTAEEAAQKIADTMVKL